jgi:hypothetical protein
MFPNLGAQQAANQGSVVSTNIPLPENAPQYNRNAHGMDIGVKRIDYDVLNKYQTSFASSVVKTVHSEFMDFIEPVGNSLDNIFLIQHLKNFDPEWHERSLDYVKNLPMTDKYMLHAYTRHGDKLINTLTRTPDEFETDEECVDLVKSCIKFNTNNVIAVQIFQELGMNPEQFLEIEWRRPGIPYVNAVGLGHLIAYAKTLAIEKVKQHLLTLAQEIKRIINAAPQLTKPIRLFRGIQYDYIATDNASAGNKLDLIGFQSMSSSIASALGFAGQYNDNNLQKHSMIYCFTLHPGTPCIAMKGVSHFPHEDEVLVNMDLQCRFEPEFAEKIFLNPAIYDFHQMAMPDAPHPKNSLYIKNIVIAPLLINRGARVNNIVNIPANNFNVENFQSNVGSQYNNQSVTSSNINAAFHQMGFGRGGRLNVRENLKMTRSNRMRNNQAKTRKRLNFAKQAGPNKMNKNVSKQEIKEVMNRIKAVEAEETDYRKVRDPGFGFVIVKKGAGKKNRNSK